MTFKNWEMWFGRLYPLTIIIAIMITSTSCKQVERDEKSEVVAVWKHDPGVYSVTIKDGITLVDKSFWSDMGRATPLIITDVPEGQNMWYEAHFSDNAFNGKGYSNVRIHIHSIKDINGAGWNHGKFGSGQTQLLERQE